MFLSASVKYPIGPRARRRILSADSLASRVAAVSSDSGARASRRTPSDGDAPSARHAGHAPSDDEPVTVASRDDENENGASSSLIVSSSRGVASSPSEYAASIAQSASGPRSIAARPAISASPPRSNSAARPEASPAMFAVTSVAFRRQSGAGPNASESSSESDAAPPSEPPPVKFEFEFGFGFAASEDDRRLASPPDPPASTVT